MLCRKQWKKQISVMVLCLGAVSFLFGLLTFLLVKPVGHALNTLMGMFSGFGFGIMLVAVFMLVRSRVLPKEKLEQQEIDRQDERNIAINHAACTVAFYAAGMLLVVFAFLFMGLGYTVPSYCCVGGLYVLAATLAIVRKVISSRM